MSNGTRARLEGRARLGRIAACALTAVLLGGCGGEAPADDPPVADAQAADPQVADAPRTYGESVAVEGGEYRDITVPELQAMREADDVPLINVHVPFAGNIPDTDESIPYDEITDHLDRLPSDRDAPIVLYCRTGPMSERAATELVGLGYTNVYNLDGGFLAWSSAGLPLEGE